MYRRLYVMYDTSAESITGPLLQFLRPAEAIRQIYDAVMNPESMLRNHPEDFKLFEIGRLNIETMAIEPHTKPMLVTTVLEIIEEHNKRAERTPRQENEGTNATEHLQES